MRWATRAGIHVDRTACAWLIRRFIDPEAEFVFVHDPDDVPDDATPFDMRGAELSHRVGGCTFETMLAHYKLDDPALADIARIVHEADLEDERYDAPEGRGLDVIIRGLSLIAQSDEQMLELSSPIYDGLHEYRRRATRLGREPG
jgi:hypothetical protein